MLRPEEIVERLASGTPSQLEEAIVIPPGWTEEDCRVVGQPVVMGHRAAGFIGAIMSHDDPVAAWYSEQTKPTHDEARDEVFAEAGRRRREFNS